MVQSVALVEQAVLVVLKAPARKARTLSKFEGDSSTRRKSPGYISPNSVDGCRCRRVMWTRFSG